MRGEPAGVPLRGDRGAIGRRGLRGNFKFTWAQHKRRSPQFAVNDKHWGRRINVKGLRLSRWFLARRRRPSPAFFGVPDSRADSQLDFPAAAFHPFECLRELGQANFLCHEIVADYIPASDGFEGLTNKSWSVMERRNELDLRIMYGGRIDGHIRSRRQSAEEIHN